MAGNCKGKCWKIGILIVVGIAVMGWVVMALWNWLMPTIFTGVGSLDYLHALGLLVLSKILFGTFRGHGCREHWQQHRWGKLSPEEREKLRTEAGACCGQGDS